MPDLTPLDRLSHALDEALGSRPARTAPVEAALGDPEVLAMIDRPLNHRGQAAIHRATRHPHGLPVLDLLLQRGANPNLREGHDQGPTPVLLCIDAVVPTPHLERLLASGGDPNLSGLGGDTALGRVLAQNPGESPDQDLLERLLNAGARWDLPNRLGESPMSLAVADGLDWVVALFVEREASQLRDAVAALPGEGMNVPSPTRPERARL